MWFVPEATSDGVTMTSVRHSGSNHALAAHTCENCSLGEQCPIGVLPAGERQEIEPEIDRPQPYHRGDTIFGLGDRVEYLSVLRAGSVKHAVLTGRGSEHVTRFSHPGDILGIEDMGGRLHTSNIEVLETSSVCRVPVARFDALMESSAAFRHCTYQRLSTHFNMAVEHALILARCNSTERVAAFVLGLAEVAGRRGYSSLQLRFSMSRHDIANYLGMASETVSRVLAGFQEMGLLSVSRRGMLQIHDMEGLQRLGGQTGAEVVSGRVCA